MEETSAAEKLTAITHAFFNTQGLLPEFIGTTRVLFLDSEGNIDEPKVQEFLDYIADTPYLVHATTMIQDHGPSISQAFANACRVHLAAAIATEAEDMDSIVCANIASALWDNGLNQFNFQSMQNARKMRAFITLSRAITVIYFTVFFLPSRPTATIEEFIDQLYKSINDHYAEMACTGYHAHHAGEHHNDLLMADDPPYNLTMF